MWVRRLDAFVQPRLMLSLATAALAAAGCAVDAPDVEPIVATKTSAIDVVPCFDATGHPTECEGLGGIRHNGTNTQPTHIRADSVAAAGVPSNFFATPGFLFEPESPYASLKTVPTWNEIEQLLDNPYAVTLDTTTPGNFDGYPSYRSTIVRRPSFAAAGATLLNPGPALPGFLVHPLNYNPTDGEEMRILNPGYPGGPFSIPDELFLNLAADPTGNTWDWTFKTVQVTPGAGRVTDTEIDYNGPLAADARVCVANLELVPPEGTQLCGFDPGEPNYAGFGTRVANGYSTPAVQLPAGSTPATPLAASARLFDPIRGTIQPRNATTGAQGLRKPSLRVPDAGGRPGQPNYRVNDDPSDTTPSNENDYVRDRNVAIALGKAFFWDMQVGSDGVQSCGTCHFTGAGTDTRTKNQINPNHLGGDLTFQLMQPNERDLVASDFPLHKLSNPDVAGDPACTTPIVANVSAVTPALDHPVSGNVTVCDRSNIVSDVNDVVSSMGVVFDRFTDIAPIGAFQPANNGVRAVMPDLRTAGGNEVDPIPGFQGIRRVEPRNTPTMQAAAFNFDNFWDGRARHDFNGGSVFGAADPQSHVFVTGPGKGNLSATRQLIKFASLASLATGPGLSEFEMSFQGRNWAKIGKKLLQAGVTPLANQLVDPNDSVLGPYSNQPGNPAPSALCPQAAIAARAAGKPGLCTTYNALIQAAYFADLWQNPSRHLVGCYTDGATAIHPNQCAGTPVIPILSAGGAVDTTNRADPFDGYVLTIANGPASATDTNQFTQMEGNFSLFWGLSVNLWVQILVPDNTPFDQFLDANPDAFMSLGDTSEVLLVDDLLNCTTPGQRNCFTEFGRFKRDPGLLAHTGATGEGGAGGTFTPAGGTRQPGDPDPLLGMDIFFASNLSLKNPTFRSGRCGACHNLPTLTDHTMPFTFKAQLPDFASEFSATAPGVELLTEPLGRLRMISGFLLESEIAENGQDAIERRFINQSIAPSPVDGYAYPDGVFNPPTYIGAGQAFIDNGVYNIGVRPIGNDIGRGGTDAFGWPLSIATLMMKNLGGSDFEPGTAMPTFDPSLGPEGGLFEESAQDQQINPGGTDEPVNPLLPPYLAPFINGIPVGDSQPELDEPFAGLNTITDVALLEGFIDVVGPVNPGAVKNEALNMAPTDLMGTNPTPNRVLRDGAFKAPQLRDVELTGPYFHNGGTLTLRQVVDFYTRGGDFPITNAAHRDFLLTNLDLEAQSNLNEAEKVALVDFLLELTDERVAFDRAPFDHPEVIVPIDGRAPDNTQSRGALLSATTGNCPGGSGPCFRDVPAVGAGGFTVREPAFLHLTNTRLVGSAAFCGPSPTSQYCH
jgi:cytochrome c peroxidase